MAELSLDELMIVLLEDVPLTEDRGFEGPGTYTVCPVCGHGLHWPDVESLPGFDQRLRDHLACHDRMEIYQVLARLVQEARAGRALRRRVEAVLAG